MMQISDDFDICSEYSREWRRFAGIKDRSGSDAAVTLLQMQGYVVTADFEYSVSRDGTIYGWGLARYATPEHCFGEDFTDHVYERSQRSPGRALKITCVPYCLRQQPGRPQRS